MTEGVVVAFPTKLERISDKVREIDANKPDAVIQGIFNMTTDQLQKTACDLWRGMEYSRQHILMLQHSIQIMQGNIDVAIKTLLSSPSQCLNQLRHAQKLCQALVAAQDEGSG